MPLSGRTSPSGRNCDDWIEEYLKYVEYTEPPTSFHRWTAIGCISAALQRKVYMDWGFERIFPNLYIVLLGPAAQTRKSTALRIGEDLVRDLGIPMIGQDNSPESVIREIKKATTNFQDGTNVKIQSAVVNFSSELSVFLGRQNTDFHKYLTDWYDSPTEWKRTTKHQGIDDITGMCFVLVGAMAPDWIPFVFTPESIGGGFTSRIFFVPEDRKSKTIVNPNKCPPPNGRRDRLLADLRHIQGEIVGPMKLSPQAEQFYEEWYARTDAEMLDHGKFAVPDKSFHTYCGRRPTLLRKVAMCISASKKDLPLIELEDIQQALFYMEESEAKMPGMFAGVGRSPQAAQVQGVLDYVRIVKKIKKSAVLQTMMQDLSADDLDGIERTLEASKLVRITRLTDENDTLYELL